MKLIIYLQARISASHIKKTIGNRCIMCRAEAHQLYAKKPIFDALGIQLFAVLHEQIEAEVTFFYIFFDISLEGPGFLCWVLLSR